MTSRTVAAGPAPGAPGQRPFLLRAALYPQQYLWYVFVSSLDVMFTWLILHFGGSEVNVLADWIIRRHDLTGLVLFKFLAVTVVILICEVVGRRRYQTAATLARWAIVLAGFPVVVGAVHLLRILEQELSTPL